MSKETGRRDKVIRARAPLRISFGGGGTDVSPYTEERGGQVLNATINRYAYVTLVPRADDSILLRSLDYDFEVRYDADDGPPGGHEMDLAKGVIRRLGLDAGHGGFHLYTHTDCPPGSGLGASSTMVVAILGAFDTWLRLGLDRYELAGLAYEIEREDLEIRGGRQDQYAAAFGGFNFMEFRRDVVLVNPLRMTADALSELEYSLVLAYTGQSRYSSQIIEKQIQNYTAGDAASVAAMDRTRELASELKHALLKGNLGGFGQLLDDAWMQKKRMSDKISTDSIDKLYSAAKKAGALGGKISGAGGGGFMYFFTEFDRRHDVIEALTQQGAEVVHFGFTDTGVHTWVIE